MFPRALVDSPQPFVRLPVEVEDEALAQFDEVSTVLRQRIIKERGVVNQTKIQ